MKTTSRRDFLKRGTLAGAFFAAPRPVFPKNAERGAFLRNAAPESFLKDIGVCTSLANDAVLRSAGCTYLEDSVQGFLAPLEPEEKLLENWAKSRSAQVPVRACNSFLPGSLKAVGPAAKPKEIAEYAETVFRRAAGVGVQTITWGSGESRKIPEGFNRARAEEQFLALAKTVAAAAGRSGVIVALEPLNSAETNFLNTLKEGAVLVEAVGHPGLALLADVYHMLMEGETPETIERCGCFIRHCHIAEKAGRTPPGKTGDDFRPFFKALKRIGYRGRMSIECRWSDLGAELPASVNFLRRQISEISAA